MVASLGFLQNVTVGVASKQGNEEAGKSQVGEYCPPQRQARWKLFPLLVLLFEHGSLTMLVLNDIFVFAFER